MPLDLDAYERQVKAVVAKRLATAGAVLTAELKRVLSVPSVGPATPGAPPRVDTGRLRASVTFLVDGDSLTVRVGTKVDYGYYLEVRKPPKHHPWLYPTTARLTPRLRRILRGEE